MRVLLKLNLDCPPDAAWRAIRSPTVFTAVSAPFTSFTSLEDDGFPELWPEGVHPVEVKAAGLIPIGIQTIEIAYPARADGVRTMRDTGRGLTGVLAQVTRWEHTMALSPAHNGTTLYRDQLIFEAGRMTPLLWPLYWAFWQWRAIGLRRLARGWHS
ncbi:MAG TPA: hypothetical protein VGP24_07960 [Glaciihabitans sp.]|nr:hypothetical protein [Glaciihabitans sp.]